MASGGLSTHILDTAKGRPAGGVRVTLHRLDEHGGGRQLLCSARTNDNGRTDAPLVTGEDFPPGKYELDFYVGDYFGCPDEAPFLDVVTVRFRTVAEQNYHVPLLVSPYGYTTYRGS